MRTRIFSSQVMLAAALVTVFFSLGKCDFANADEPNISSARKGDAQSLEEIAKRLRGFSDSSHPIASEDFKQEIAAVKAIDLANRKEHPETYIAQRDLKFRCLAMILVAVNNRIDPSIDPRNPQASQVSTAPTPADFQLGIPLMIGADSSRFKDPKARRIHEEFARRNAESGRTISEQWELLKIRDELVSRAIFPFVKLNYSKDDQSDIEELDRVMAEEIESVQLRDSLEDKVAELDKKYRVQHPGHLIRRASSSP